MDECFKRILSEIHTPIDDSVKIMNELGVSVFDDGNIKSLEDIFKELQNALKGMNHND